MPDSDTSPPATPAEILTATPTPAATFTATVGLPPEISVHLHPDAIKALQPDPSQFWFSVAGLFLSAVGAFAAAWAAKAAQDSADASARSADDTKRSSEASQRAIELAEASYRADNEPRIVVVGTKGGSHGPQGSSTNFELANHSRAPAHDVWITITPKKAGDVVGKELRIGPESFAPQQRQLYTFSISRSEVGNRLDTPGLYVEIEAEYQDASDRAYTSHARFDWDHFALAFRRNADRTT